MKKNYKEPESAEIQFKMHLTIMASRESIDPVSIESLTVEDDSDEWN